MTELQTYNLPDQELLLGKSDKNFVWQPDKTYIILGQRDNIEDAVEIKSAKSENAIIMQRPSGGHSVVLTPKTVIVSMISHKHELTAIKSFFHDCNMKIIKALQKQNIQGLSIQGISDIVLNGKKIVGSSMYKGKDFLFFHAVVNLSENPKYIAQFLKHPKTEPEYRKNRKHEEFITSLAEQGYDVNVKSFKECLV
jgi:lipoate-protein ligase A